MNSQAYDRPNSSKVRLLKTCSTFGYVCMIVLERFDPVCYYFTGLSCCIYYTNLCHEFKPRITEFQNDVLIL